MDEEDGVLSGPVYERLNKYHAAQQMRLHILKQRQEEEVRRRRALLLPSITCGLLIRLA